MLETTESQNNTPVVEKMVFLGILCKNYEKAAGTKSNYTKLIRKKFGAHKFQVIQQSRRLAAQPEFCKTYSYLGKNRLLAVLSLCQDEDAVKVMEKHPLPDTDNCDGGEVHFDALITLCRMDKKGIDCVSL